MDFDLLFEKAKSNCEALLREDLIKVRVSALSDNPDRTSATEAFRNGLKRSGTAADVIRTGSFGYYAMEPLVLIKVPGHPCLLYPNVDATIADQLVQSYLVGGDPRIEMAWCSLGPDTFDTLPLADDLPLFKSQQRIALKNCGLIDPERIESCIVGGRGYSGLSRALGMSREQVIRQLSESGLRGRGGAGYPTAQKWEAVAQAKSDKKIVVCNAIDSDERALTARLLLEGDPHRVLEGLLIAAYTVGADRCIICVDEVQTTSRQRLENALSRMRDYGLPVGSGPDSAFNTDIQVRAIQGGLVAGEETALLRALEGRQAMPYLRGPYPSEQGLGGSPTLIQNVETLACVAAIFQESSQYFASIGTPRSTGTKIITLTNSAIGHCSIEVPFGTSIRQILASSGVASGSDAVKAVQLGGVSGSYWADDTLDRGLDFDAIFEAGTILGSGTIDVVAVNACMVQEAARAMAYIHDQSCGKCVFCREGTLQMSDALDSMWKGQGTPEDLALLKELGEEMRAGCICGLGRSAANPVLSAMTIFQTDFDSHAQGLPCPADPGSDAGRE